MTPEQDAMVLENMPLVTMNLRGILAAMSQKPVFLEWDDLQQAGTEGLIRAVLELELLPDTIRWTTFANWHIRQAIRDQLEGGPDRAGERQIRLPHRVHVSLNRINRMADVLTQQLRREPTADEIGQQLGIGARDVDEIRGLSKRTPDSLDRLREDEDGNTPADLGRSIFDDNVDEISDPIVLDTLEEVLASPMLSEKELEVLNRSVVGDESFEEIGDNYGVSRQRIQQIQSRALRKIQQDSRMRRQHDEELFMPNMRTAHLLRGANRERSDDEWWETNTVKLEWTDERRRQWRYGSMPVPMLGFRL